MDPPDALRAFRRSFYECFYRRRDALFELADAILAADGAAPSPAHLSLEASHRRGWGSLYAALDRGRIDEEALRKLLACHPLAGTEGEVAVFAVDTSVWDRCDAETSPLLKAITTIRRGTPPGSPSSQVGPTSSSHNWASSARAGPPRWT
jgi:DDE superfamily endonuclease